MAGDGCTQAVVALELYGLDQALLYSRQDDGPTPQHHDKERAAGGGDGRDRGKGSRKGKAAKAKRPPGR